MSKTLSILQFLAAAVGAAVGWYYEAPQGHPYAGIIWGALVGALLCSFVVSIH